MSATLPYACSSTQGDFRGWQSCILQNGLIRLVAVPDIGGRIMAYDLGPYAFFFVDPQYAGKLFSPEENQGDGSLAAWKNYGGDKTWPAPQGWDHDAQWHGPPDPVLDTGRYTLDELNSSAEMAQLRMVSPPDARTGIRITRQFTIQRGSARVQVALTFTNISSKPVRWSIWDVAQLRAERVLPDGQLAYEPQCVVTAPLNPTSRFPNGYAVMFGAQDNPQWQTDAQAGLFQAPYQWQIGKVGLDSTAGWIAFSNPAQGYAFAEHFRYEPGAEYPDNGASVEVWTVGAGQVANLDYSQSSIYLMETEVLSPLRTIAPGESTTFTLEWGACRCTGMVREVASGGVVVEPLTARPQTGFVRLRGQFGVFDTGSLQLVWFDAQQQVIHQQELGAANPLAAVAVDLVTPQPEHASAVELRVLTTTGARALACASLSAGQE